MWAGGCWAAAAAGYPAPPAVVLAGAAVAGGYAIWPDMDTQGTAARALWWFTRGPALLIARLGHRGATHWIVTQFLLGGALAVLAVADVVTGVGLSGYVIALGLVWCVAGFDADDPAHRRRSFPGRVALAVVGTWLALRYAGTWWVPLAVTVGGLAHIAGDNLTRSRFRYLAPFSWRKYGGLGWIPPTRRGQRVTRQEWCFEVGLWAVTVVAVGATVSWALAAVGGAWSLWTLAQRLAGVVLHPVRTRRRTRRYPLTTRR